MLGIVVFSKTILLFDSVPSFIFYLIDVFFIMEFFHVDFANIVVDLKEGVDYVSMVFKQVRVEDIRQLQPLDQLLADLKDVLERIYAFQIHFSLVDYNPELLSIIGSCPVLLQEQTQAELARSELLLVFVLARHWLRLLLQFLAFLLQLLAEVIVVLDAFDLLVHVFDVVLDHAGGEEAAAVYDFPTLFDNLGVSREADLKCL